MAESTLEVIFTGTDKTLSSTANKIGRSFGQVGNVIKTGLAVGATAIVGLSAGAVVLGKELVSLGADANETASLIQTSLGSATDSFNSRLRDFASEANRSFFELQDGSSTLIAMTKAMGATENQAADLSLTFAQMAPDLGSFFNVADADVFADLQSALGGSSETLQKYGIDIRETTLKQMALNQGMIESASDVLPPLIRAQLIQQAITEQAGDAMGDAIRTSDSWQNSLRGLRGRVLDAATSAGQKLIPALQPLLGLAGELAERAIGFLTEKFEQLLPLLTEGALFISNIVEAIQSGMTPLQAFNFAWGTLGRHLGLSSETIKLVRERLAAIVETFNTVKEKVVEFLAPIIEWIGKNVELKDVLIGLSVVLSGAVLTSIIGIATALAPIIITIGAVIAAVALLRKAWETDFLGIRTAITEWAEEHGGIMQGIMDWWEAVKITWNQLKTIIVLGIDFLVSKWEWFRNQIVSIVGSIKIIWDGLANKFQSVKNGIVAALQPIIDLINQVKDALAQVELPEWMTPGSPTPWELGLKGVREQMALLNTRELPGLQANLQGFEKSGATTTTTNNNQQFNFNVNTQRFNPESAGRSVAAFATGGI